MNVFLAWFFLASLSAALIFAAFYFDLRKRWRIVRRECRRLQIDNDRLHEDNGRIMTKMANVLHDHGIPGTVIRGDHGALSGIIGHPGIQASDVEDLENALNSFGITDPVPEPTRAERFRAMIAAKNS